MLGAAPDTQWVLTRDACCLCVADSSRSKKILCWGKILKTQGVLKGAPLRLGKYVIHKSQEGPKTYQIHKASTSPRL